MNTPSETTVVPAVDGKEEPEPDLAVSSGKTVSGKKTPKTVKTAISRHFVERNSYFRDNPRRAGNKIWEIDFFQDMENLNSGNYREW